MNDYRSQYGLDPQPVEPTTTIVTQMAPQPHDYSLEEYLRLRDAMSRKGGLPEFSEDTTLGLFSFSVYYVLPFALFCAFFAPIFGDIMGETHGVAIFVMASLCFYLIYKLPSISRAMRKREAIDLAERDKEEYEAFIKQNRKSMKKKRFRE